MKTNLLRVVLFSTLFGALLTPAVAQTPAQDATTADTRVTTDDDDRDFPWGLLGLLGLAGLIPRKSRDHRNDSVVGTR